MFRVSALIVKTPYLLVRRSTPAHINARGASGVFTHKDKSTIKERPPCPPQPPLPPPPPPNDAWVWGTITAILMAGCFAAYAKSNPEVRDWLSVYLPWFDDLVAILYEENYSLKESMVHIAQGAKKKLDCMLSSYPEDCPKETIIPVDVDYCGDTIEPPKVAVQDDDDDDDDDEDECVLESAPVITKDVCEVEACIKDIGEDIYNSYLTAKDSSDYCNKLAEETTENFSYQRMLDTCEEIKVQDEEVIKKHICLAQEGFKPLNDLVKYVDCGCQASEERLNVTRQMAADYKTRHERIKILLDNSYLTLTQHRNKFNLVRPVLDKYTREMSSMYPRLNYADEKPTTGDGDIDFLLIQHYKNMMLLCKQYIDKDTVMSNKIEQGIRNKIPDRKEAEKKVDEALKKATADMVKKMKDKETALKKANDDELKKKLAEQKKLHEENVKRQVDAIEQNFLDNKDQMVEDKMAAPRAEFKRQLDELKAKVAKVESQVNERIKAEKERERSKKLHQAALELLKALQMGCPRVRVDKQLKALQDNAGVEMGDKLVTTVLNSIPHTVFEKGVVPASVLRRRYHSMETVALKVSMIEGEGGALPAYAFSWLQYMVLAKPMLAPVGIPQKEIDQPLQEPFENMDTFDLMQRASHFVEKGDLGQAVRYVDALEGASRGAAEGWYRAANEHLQTKQAAETIAAHAAALGLQYV